MADTPEDKARRRQLLQEIWKLEQEVGLAEDDLTIDEILAITEQVRKELAEKRRKKGKQK